MKERAGTWLDMRKAFVVHLQASGTKTYSLDSGIEEFHPKGGARSRQPWGPMDKVSERRYMERKKHQTRRYFSKIKEALGKAQQIVIMGPSLTKKEFEKFIISDNTYNPEILGLFSEDLMTDNQIIARVKEVFAEADSR
jgi:hypothetical protein